MYVYRHKIFVVYALAYCLCYINYCLLHWDYFTSYWQISRNFVQKWTRSNQLGYLA